MSAIDRNGVKVDCSSPERTLCRSFLCFLITCTVYSSVMQLGFALTAIDHLARLGSNGSALG